MSKTLPTYQKDVLPTTQKSLPTTQKRVSVALLLTTLVIPNILGMVHWYTGRKAMAMAKLMLVLVCIALFYALNAYPNDFTRELSFELLIRIFPLVVIWWAVDFATLLFIASTRSDRFPFGMRGPGVRWYTGEESYDKKLSQGVVLLVFAIVVFTNVITFLDSFPGKCIPRKDFNTLRELFSAHPVAEMIQGRDTSTVGNLVGLLKNETQVIKLHDSPKSGFWGHSGANYTSLYCRLPDAVKALTASIDQLGYYDKFFYTIQERVKGVRLMEWAIEKRTAEEGTGLVREYAKMMKIFWENGFAHNDLHTKQIYYDHASKKITFLDLDVATLDRWYKFNWWKNIMDKAAIEQMTSLLRQFPDTLRSAGEPFSFEDGNKLANFFQSMPSEIRSSDMVFAILFWYSVTRDDSMLDLVDWNKGIGQKFDKIINTATGLPLAGSQKTIDLQKILSYS